jgi:hypothetical protein
VTNRTDIIRPYCHACGAHVTMPHVSSHTADIQHFDIESY